MCFDRPVTVVALKRLGAGVFAVVPRQLVAPGESPLAALPRALVRLLTWGMKKTRISTCFIAHPPITRLFVCTLLWPCKKKKHQQTSVGLVWDCESKYLVPSS